MVGLGCADVDTGDQQGYFCLHVAQEEMMASEEPCLIASKSAVRGQISGKQDLIVEGRVEGRVGLESHLIIEESGTVEADMDVNQVTIKGEARGDVVAARSAVLQATARMAGKIRSPQVVIEDGAKFSGTIEMEVELPAGIKAGGA
jgi:cytoskeletal protein CcmA (bactofilin family)